MHLANAGEGNVIRSCNSNGIVVGSDTHECSIIVTETQVSEWSLASIETASEADFECLLPFQPELVLVGTGERQQFPNPEKYACLLNARVGIEFMTSAAACRTYNIVMMEGRQVLAALIRPAA